MNSDQIVVPLLEFYYFLELNLRLNTNTENRCHLETNAQRNVVTMEQENSDDGSMYNFYCDYHMYYYWDTSLIKYILHTSENFLFQVTKNVQ